MGCDCENYFKLAFHAIYFYKVIYLNIPKNKRFGKASLLKIIPTEKKKRHIMLKWVF